MTKPVPNSIIMHTSNSYSFLLLLPTRPLLQSILPPTSPHRPPTLLYLRSSPCHPFIHEIFSSSHTHDKYHPRFQPNIRVLFLSSCLPPYLPLFPSLPSPSCLPPSPLPRREVRSAMNHVQASLMEKPIY